MCWVHNSLWDYRKEVEDLGCDKPERAAAAKDLDTGGILYAYSLMAGISCRSLYHTVPRLCPS